jgi:hypothetical protein
MKVVIALQRSMGDLYTSARVSAAAAVQVAIKWYHDEM